MENDMNRHKQILWIVLVLLFSILGCDENKAQNEGAKLPGGDVGMAADFTLKSLEGEEFKLSSFRGKNPVYLVFWATWCPYCVKEIPRLKELYAKLAPRGLKILAINISYNDPLLRVQTFQKKYELPYPILYDNNAVVSRQYGVIGVPYSVLIDRSGKVVYRSNGTPEGLEAFVEKEKPA
jgi:peroxiredoxin